MAEDDPKDKAKREPAPAKTPVAEAAAARAKRTRSAAAKPVAANSDSKPEPGDGETKTPDAASPEPAAPENGAPENGAPENGAPENQAGAPEGPGLRLPGSTAALAGIFAAVILVVLLIAWPGGRAFVAGLFAGPNGTDIAALNKRLGALESTLTRLDKDIAALKAEGAAAKAGEEARAALEKRIAALESRPSGADLAARLETAEKRLSDLQPKIAALDARVGKAEAGDGSRTLAVMALAGALRTGGAFAGLAARVSGDIGADGPVPEGLKALAAYAGKGVPTVAGLAARLETLVVAAKKAPAAETKPIDAAAAAEKPAGLWDKVKANILKLGRVRKAADTAPPRDPAASLRAAAAEALVRGDLAAAAEISKDLAGAEGAAWRRDLDARIVADRLAAELDRLIAARLGRPAAKP